MKIYAVKNDTGEYAFCEIGKPHWETSFGTLWTELNKPYAQQTADDIGGQVVPLIEAPAKVVLPAWFDDFVQKYEDNLANEEQARFRIIGKICQSGWGTTFNDQLNRDVPDNFNPFDLDDGQLKYVHAHRDELVRALSLNSWTVEKQKRYVLPMPDGTPDELDQGKYLAIRDTGGSWHGSESRYDITKPAKLEYFSVTQTDIDAAPDWVKAITPVEVTDDEQ